MNPFIVISYGGGDFMATILNGVAMFFGSTDFTFALKLCALIASLGILCTASFQGRLPEFRWILIMICIYTALFVPKVTVLVMDPVKRQPGFPLSSPTQIAVANVPIGLAAVASLTSGLKDYLTLGFETVFSLPDEISFRHGGALFAQELVSDVLAAGPRNANLAISLDNFWKNCVFYDIALGFYSMSQLSNAPDIQKFLAANTASGRGFEFIYDNGQSGIEICRDAISPGGALNDAIQNDISPVQSGVSLIGGWIGFVQQINGSPSNAQSVLQSGAAALPVAFQYLTGMALSESQILSRSILQNSFAMHGLSSFASKGQSQNFVEDYAATKAEIERNTTYSVMGKISAKMLPLLNIIAEGTLYAIFPVVALLMMFPFAGKMATGYIQALAWIALWSPLYALFHYFSMYFTHAAVSAGALVCDVYANCQPQLNLYTMKGINNSLQNSAVISGYLCTMVPMIAYMVISRSGAMLTGVVSRFTDGYQQPVSHAAQEAAAGNMTLGNVAYQNIQAWQQNSAPSQSSGFQLSNDGRWEDRETDAGQTHRMVQSSGAVDIALGRSVQSAISTRLDDATTERTIAAESLSEANMALRTQLVEASHQVTHGKTVANESGNQNQLADTKSTQNSDAVANRYAESHGLKWDASKGELVRVSEGLGAEVSVKIPGTKIEVEGGGHLYKDKITNKDNVYTVDEGATKELLHGSDYTAALRNDYSAFEKYSAKDDRDVSDTGRAQLVSAYNNQTTAQTQYTTANERVESLTAITQDMTSNSGNFSLNIQTAFQNELAREGGDYKVFNESLAKNEIGAREKLHTITGKIIDEFVGQAVDKTADQLIHQGDIHQKSVRVSGAADVNYDDKLNSEEVNAQNEKYRTTQKEGQRVQTEVERTKAGATAEMHHLQDRQKIEGTGTLVEGTGAISRGVSLANQVRKEASGAVLVSEQPESPPGSEVGGR